MSATTISFPPIAGSGRSATPAQKPEQVVILRSQVFQPTDPRDRELMDEYRQFGMLPESVLGRLSVSQQELLVLLKQQLPKAPKDTNNINHAYAQGIVEIQTFLAGVST